MNEEQRKFYFYKMRKNNLCPIHKCRLKDGSCGFCAGKDPPRLTQGVTQRERKAGRQDNLIIILPLEQEIGKIILDTKIEMNNYIYWKN